MIRVTTDFQAIDSKGSLFILRVNNEDFDNKAVSLGVKIGDKVILDAHEDFEITGTLDFRFVDPLAKKSRVADPDWSTRVDKAV